MGANCQCERQPGGKIVIMAEANPFGVGACSNVSVAEKDSKGMLNHRLLVAARDNNLDALRKAVNEGAYLETRRPFVMRPQPPASGQAQARKKKPPREGFTPLMYVVQNGSAAATRLLLEAKASVNAKDEDGIRPLHLAAGAGEMEVCKLLLTFGADRVAADDDGRRAIHHVPRDNLATKGDRAQWEAVLGPATDCIPAAVALAEGGEAAAAAQSAMCAEAVFVPTDATS